MDRKLDRAKRKQNSSPSSLNGYENAAIEEVELVSVKKAWVVKSE